MDLNSGLVYRLFINSWTTFKSPLVQHIGGRTYVKFYMPAYLQQCIALGKKTQTGSGLSGVLTWSEYNVNISGFLFAGNTLDFFSLFLLASSAIIDGKNREEENRRKIASQKIGSCL